MIAQGGGDHIINITSVHEDWPMPGNTAYCLSKGGMRMLTRTAGVGSHPTVCSSSASAPARSHPDQPATEADPANIKGSTRPSLGRMADPKEIASVVAFLAGDGASYITATTIFADGGIMQSSPGL